MMTKHEITNLPAYFQNYVQQVPETELTKAFHSADIALQKLDISALEKLGLYIYAPGKWTIPDILQHLIDTERIMAFRSLSFARGESQSLPGYDDEQYAKEAGASTRSVQSLLTEWKAVRETTKMLFESFSNDQITRKGTANNHQVSVLALGFIIIGHQYHHLKIISDRYLH